MALYTINFNDDFATRDQITAHLDKNRAQITNWHFSLTNTIFVATNLTGAQLRDYLLQVGKKEGRFFISKVRHYPNYDGWLPEQSWNFIREFASEE